MERARSVVGKNRRQAISMLYALIFNRIGTAQFEHWLQTSSEPMSLLCTDDLLALHTFDFSRKTRELEEVVRSLFLKTVSVDIWKIRAHEISSIAVLGQIILSEACAKLTEMNMNGMNFVPVTFVGYHDELESTNGRLLEFYRDRILHDLVKLRDNLHHILQSVLGFNPVEVWSLPMQNTTD